MPAKTKLIKRYRPTTSSRRLASVLRIKQKKRPKKSLLGKILKRSGRDSFGHISVRHRGGGNKRLYRLVDFRQTRFDVPATIEAIEYDPNRNARILLIKYADGKYSYILAYKDAEIGHQIITSNENVPIRAGNRTRLKNIPLGTEVHNVEIQPNGGAKLFRAAGTYGIIEAKEEKYINLRTPSKETRMVSANCFASIGAIGNAEYSLVRIGKAGRNRHRGIRPTVRGVVMSPRAHPHGGGEGKSPIGLKSPKTFTGKIARGVRTRRKHKYSNQFIVKKRRK
ncbi:MAG: 50S ribosomal protein L2 [Candidatus Berkelbacteria bacterium]|nr:50S ribosomal protein L2 [Candidatus Berkelbacteria bacterium]